jgi:hypothetical protein
LADGSSACEAGEEGRATRLEFYIKTIHYQLATGVIVKKIREYSPVGGADFTD